MAVPVVLVVLVAVCVLVVPVVVIGLLVVAVPAVLVVLVPVVVIGLLVVAMPVVLVVLVPLLVAMGILGTSHRQVGQGIDELFQANHDCLVGPRLLEQLFEPTGLQSHANHDHHIGVGHTRDILGPGLEHVHIASGGYKCRHFHVVPTNLVDPVGNDAAAGHDPQGLTLLGWTVTGDRSLHGRDTGRQSTADHNQENGNKSEDRTRYSHGDAPRATLDSVILI